MIELNNYNKLKIIKDIFSGIGIVYILTAFLPIDINLILKLIIGIIIGSLIAWIFYKHDDFKEAFLNITLRKEIKEELLKEKNEEIRQIIEGTKDMNRFVLAAVSLATIVANVDEDIKFAEKITVIREFVKELEKIYEFKEETKNQIEGILKRKPDLLEILKELRDLKLSVFVQNKVSDLLWSVALEDGYMSIAEEKILDSWNIVYTNI